MIEGVASNLDPEINLWHLVKPWFRHWFIKNIGVEAQLKDSFNNALEIGKAFPKLIARAKDKINSQNRDIYNDMLLNREYANGFMSENNMAKKHKLNSNDYQRKISNLRLVAEISIVITAFILGYHFHNW